MLAPGAQLGDFENIAELGRGEMGIVYRARQVALGRVVAAENLPAYARHGPAAIQRFRVEAEAAARVHHTNMVSVYGQRDSEGQFYCAMELTGLACRARARWSEKARLFAARRRNLRRAGGPTDAIRTPYRY